MNPGLVSTFRRGRRPAPRAGFTLIEILIVAAIIGLICAVAIPNLQQLAKKTGLRRAISDLREVCDTARRTAIFTGEEVTLVFYPLERRFYVSGRALDDELKGQTTGIIPEDVTIDMLDVNQSEYKDSTWTRVRFYPGGTCDELTIALLSDQGDRRWLVLEPATALLVQTSNRP